MNNKMFLALGAALAVSVSASAAVEMEKCKVVDKNGKGLIKASKGDCGGTNNSCAGNNLAGDPEAWIMVPKGQCAKINQGDFSGVDDSVKNRIETAK